MKTRRGGLRTGAFLQVLLATVASEAWPATLTVSNSSDRVNGDVASPAALVAKPGPDGISLREALLAANAVPGPHSIAFAPALGGATIRLQDTLPPLRRDGLTLRGLRSGGAPAITLDGEQIGLPTDPAIVRVQASHVTVADLRFVRSPVSLLGVINVEAGAHDSGRRPLVVDDVLIAGNIIDQSDVTFPPGFSIKGIELRTEPGEPLVTGAAITNVTLRDNVIVGIHGDNDAIVAGTGGRRSRIENLVVVGNTIRDCSFGVEVGGHTGPGNLVRGIRIERNRFEDVGTAIPVGIDQPGNRFEGLVVRENVFVGGENGVVAGVPTGPGAVVEDVRIERNTFAGVNNVVSLFVFGQNDRLSRAVISGNTTSSPGGTVNLVTTGEGNVLEDVEITDNDLSAVAAIAPGGTGGLIQHVVFSRNVNRNPDFFLSLCGVKDG